MLRKTVPFTLEIREVAPAPDFFPAIDPAAAAVDRGADAVYQITFAPANGFAHLIGLAVLGLPQGTEATFSSNPAQATDVVTLTIATGSAAAGVYSLEVEATEVEPEPEPGE